MRLFILDLNTNSAILSLMKNTSTVARWRAIRMAKKNVSRIKENCLLAESEGNTTYARIFEPSLRRWETFLQKVSAMTDKEYETRFVLGNEPLHSLMS